MMDLGFKSNPNMHRGPEVAHSECDRSRANVGGAGRFFWERLRDANQLYVLAGLQYRSLRRLGGSLLLVQQQQNPKPINYGTQLVSLRSSLDYEVAWRPVKGQDERQKTAPLTALHATGGIVVDVARKNMEGRHVGLDFYDLLIEGRGRDDHR